MARAEHPNKAVETTFQDLETHRGYKIVLAPSKAEFILYCKENVECGRVTADPTRGLARSAVNNVIQRHARGHK